MKKLTSVLAIGLALTASSAFAADGTITINGEVTATTCTINNGTKNFTVTLPTLPTSTFTGVNSVSGLTQFTFTLTGCLNATGKSARTYFEPSVTGIGTGGNVLNTSGTGTGLAFQLLNKNKNPINPNLDVTSQDPDNTQFSINSGSAIMNYFVQYIQVSSPVNPGTIKGSVAYDIHYM